MQCGLRKVRRDGDGPVQLYRATGLLNEPFRDTTCPIDGDHRFANFIPGHEVTEVRQSVIEVEEHPYSPVAGLVGRHIQLAPGVPSFKARVSSRHASTSWALLRASRSAWQASPAAGPS